MRRKLAYCREYQQRTNKKIEKVKLLAFLFFETFPVRKNFKSFDSQRLRI